MCSLARPPKDFAEVLSVQAEGHFIRLELLTGAALRKNHA